MNKRRLSLVGGVIGFIAAYMIVKLWFSPSPESVIKETVDHTNKACPVMVDEFTQLDSISMPGGTHFLQYHYTVISNGLDEIDIDSAQVVHKNALIDNIRTEPGMKVLRENDVAFNFIYANKQREKLMEILVIPADYK